MTEHETCKVCGFPHDGSDHSDCVFALKQEVDRKSEIIIGLAKGIEGLRRGHYYCEDSWYSCPKADGGCANESEGEDCNCGADKINAIIDSLLSMANHKESLSSEQPSNTRAEMIP
jgi:hypothetical protein